MKFEGDKTGKSKKTAEAFNLNEIYRTHDGELKDLLRIREVYSDTYLDKLGGLFKGNISREEMYRLAFGTYIEEDSLGKRPLSKMKKDILTELRVIKKDDEPKQ